MPSSAVQDSVVPTAVEPMLDLDSVRVRFAETIAVDDVSLSVASGEFVSLLGPSGCGKTTLLRSIAGYVLPDAGSVRLSGRTVTYASVRNRRIGMVFQNYALFPHMTVGDNVAFGLRMHRMPRAAIARRVEEMLELVHLSALRERRPAELSGGQQQRVALARALAFDPQLLLLDEPLGALDLRLREAMQVEIKRVQRETGVTTIFVTHDQGEALAMSDRVAVMRDGHIEQIGPPHEIYAEPVSTYVAEFVGKSNLLDARVVVAQGPQCTVALGDTGIHTVCGSHVGDLVTGAACKVAVRPEHVEIVDDGARGQLRATVESVQYMGTHHLVGLRTAQGDTVLASSPEARSIGEAASVTWDAAHARALPA